MKVLLLPLFYLVLFISISTARDAKDEESRVLSSERSPRSLGQQSSLCPTIKFPCTTMPNICANMRHAINVLGKPSVLKRTRNAFQIRRNRRQSGCQSLGRKPGYSCDRYPFPSSFQGGAGAVVRLVPARENFIQGGTLSAFYRKHNIGHGDCFTVSVKLRI